jgi:hypothetical protein
MAADGADGVNGFQTSRFAVRNGGEWQGESGATGPLLRLRWRSTRAQCYTRLLAPRFARRVGASDAVRKHGESRFVLVNRVARSHPSAGLRPARKQSTA